VRSAGSEATFHFCEYRSENTGTEKRDYRIDPDQVLIRAMGNPAIRSLASQSPDFASTSILETL
jgi:hypothetical protein